MVMMGWSAGMTSSASGEGAAMGNVVYCAGVEGAEIDCAALEMDCREDFFLRGAPGAEGRGLGWAGK